MAISFDAAWGDEFTEGILDILDTYDVKATFFLVDFWAKDYPDDVKLIASRGHDIGNHSTTHPIWRICRSRRLRGAEYDGGDDRIPDGKEAYSFPAAVRIVFGSSDQYSGLFGLPDDPVVC